MRSPQSTVWILGLPFKFVIKKDLLEDGQHYHGEFDRWTRTITMAADPAPRPDIFMHEACHAAVWSMLKGGEANDTIREELICNLPYAVTTSVTQDPRNARLLQWLKGK